MRRDRGRFLGGFLLALALPVAGVCYLASRDYVLSVGEPEIQRRLDAAFPIKKTYGGGVNIELTHPVIRLEPGTDRVALTVDAGADVLNGLLRTGGTGRLSGRVRYVPASRAVFLDDASVERLEVPGLPEQYAGILREGAGLAAREYFAAHPVYEFRRPLFGGALRGTTVKNIAVEGGTLKITLGR